MVVEKGISKEDIPMMMAIQNHRHWVDEFMSVKDADTSRLAEIGRDPCVSNAGTKIADRPAIGG